MAEDPGKGWGPGLIAVVAHALCAYVLTQEKSPALRRNEQWPTATRLQNPAAFASRFDLLRHGASLFLLPGNVASEGSSVLRLWVADDLDGEFAEHPSSLLRISAQRRADGREPGDNRWPEPIRVGQDLRGGYGDGIALFRGDNGRVVPYYAEAFVGAGCLRTGGVCTRWNLA